MTLKRPKRHESQNEIQNHVDFTCFGEYCTLVNSLDQQRDVIKTDQDVKNNKFTSEEVENSRDRASMVLKRLLLKSELTNLEESGKMIHLKIPKPICKLAKQEVPKESILMSQREHRLAYLELTQAEDANFQIIDHADKEDVKLSKSSGSAINGLNVKSQSNITTCEMCYHVYRLLSHTRCLLSRSYRTTPLGLLEDKVFNLNKIVEKSVTIPMKALTKPKINNRSPLKISKEKEPNANDRKKDKKPVIKAKNQNVERQKRSNSCQPIKNSERERCQRKKDSPKYDSFQRGEVKKVIDKFRDSIDEISHEHSPIKVESSVQMFTHNDQTEFPYTVLGSTSPHPQSQSNKGKRHEPYNMVVCHDLFDTLERMKIFLSSFLEQYPYHQILLWNYPGQAYTKFPSAGCLNNEFHAECLNGLLRHVGIDGTNEFDHTKPFFLLGHGYGASVACQHAAKCQYIPGLRGLFLINPLTFVDVHFASVMHDCRNVFSCSPETRPDLPLYFYSRFIFCKDYLNNVSTPLALNLYTAIHNPITVRGRISLCDGVLNNVDLRESLKLIKAPILTLHGKNAELVRPIHATSFLEGRNQCATIHGAVSQPGSKSTVLIMSDGGHELFQEKKRKILAMIVALLSGYHENNKSHAGDREHSAMIQSSGAGNWGNIIQQSMDFSRQEKKEQTSNTRTKVDVPCASKSENIQNKEGIPKTAAPTIDIMLDPANPCFERHQNNVYKAGNGGIYPASNEFVKPQEYMSWRLKRNRKRLSRFQKAATIIQGALRVYMAKTMIARLKRQRSALNIQRCYRGMIGRRIFNEKRRELWAARLVQRVYRGAIGRRTSYYRRISIQAQITIARVWRGYIDRKLVSAIRRERNIAAIHLQCLWRRCMAIDQAQYLRTRKQSSTKIQRVFRGHLGRKKAEKERDKYVFSKSQSMGIELGRQMLAEHKLKATRLQSELSILEKEWASIESKVELISSELDKFQVNAKKLEKSMHDIVAVEAQKRFDVATQHAIRQKKV